MASIQTILPDSRDDLLYVKKFQKGKLIFCGYKREYLARNLSQMEEGFVTCSVCSGIRGRNGLRILNPELIQPGL